MLRDTKAIAEREPRGIITHNYLFFVLKFSFFYDGVLLLEFLSHCTKILTQSQYKDISLEVKKLSVFSLRLCFVYKKKVQ